MKILPLLRPVSKAIVFLLFSCGLLAGQAQALKLETQYQGFASQGVVTSNGNNLFGKSTSGTLSFYEYGINGSVSPGYGLLLSGQVLLRDAGASDNEGLRIDYALLDYQIIRRPDFNFGLRAGRVKNPLGLYNESRDVIFTRPGITLPESIYIDGQGFRRIIFSSDGGQAYGSYTLGNHTASLVAGLGLSRTATEDEERQAFGGPFPGQLRFRNFRVARLQDEIDGGRWRLALSYLQNRLVLNPDPGIPFSGAFTYRSYSASAQRNWEKISLTAEYLINKTTGFINPIGPVRAQGDGGYLQAEYRFLPTWSALARYDLSFVNSHDRNGSEFAAQTGGDRHSQFAKDATLGLDWRPNAHWGVWGEFHLIDGTSSVSALDNPSGARKARWNALLLMAAYRF